MSLQDWYKFGWLKPHQTSCQELSNLLAIADRDISDATCRTCRAGVGLGAVPPVSKFSTSTCLTITHGNLLCVLCGSQFPNPVNPVNDVSKTKTPLRFFRHIINRINRI